MSSDASRTAKVRMFEGAFTIDVTLHCTAVAYMVIMSNRVQAACRTSPPAQLQGLGE
jgi:hypothetical protein